MFKMLSVGVLIALGLGLGIGLRNAAAAPLQATLYVAHGINGVDLGEATSDLPVDIKIGKTCAFPDVIYKTVSAATGMAAGTITVEVSHANTTTPCSNAPFLKDAFILESGKTYTLLVHLNERGRASLTRFRNNLTATGADKTRIEVHHAAFAPGVDVTLKLATPTAITRTFKNVRQGRTITETNTPGDWTLTATPHDWPSTVVLGPTVITTAASHAYFVFVVGSAKNGLTALTLSAATP